MCVSKTETVCVHWFALSHKETASQTPITFSKWHRLSVAGQQRQKNDCDANKACECVPVFRSIPLSHSSCAVIKSCYTDLQPSPPPNPFSTVEKSTDL